MVALHKAFAYSRSCRTHCSSRGPTAPGAPAARPPARRQCRRRKSAVHQHDQVDPQRLKSSIQACISSLVHTSRSKRCTRLWGRWLSAQSPYFKALFGQLRGHLPDTVTINPTFSCFFHIALSLSFKPAGARGKTCGGQPGWALHRARRAGQADDAFDVLLPARRWPPGSASRNGPGGPSAPAPPGNAARICNGSRCRS